MLNFISRRRVAVAGAALAGAALVGTATVALGGPAVASDHPQVVAAQLDGSFIFHPCPAGTPAADLCLTDHITTTLPGLGSVGGPFEVHIAFSSFAADGCGPIDKSGEFSATDGSILRVRATGLYCSASSIATYDYRITGGTGKAQDASGSGIWLVPPPATFSGSSGTGPEFFHGTLSIGD